jgi:hypothetical protein
MSWKKERDALIAQTMAFVQSVTGRKEEFGTAAGGFAPAPTAPPALPPALDNHVLPKPIAAFEPAKPAELAQSLEPASSLEPLPPQIAALAPRVAVPGEMANEIRARIAGFRAHQERFNREREEYFSQTLAKLKATLKEMPPPRAGK